ncbi:MULTISPECIES: hypothetical protein [unclassified Microcoleus]|uniref:hypothetical protein n=1 Tax=unclassified Microcoleus TaxID=2642155 RepID=UPI002FD405FB
MRIDHDAGVGGAVPVVGGSGRSAFTGNAKLKARARPIESRWQRDEIFSTNRELLQKCTASLNMSKA